MCLYNINVVYYSPFVSQRSNRMADFVVKPQNGYFYLEKYYIPTCGKSCDVDETEGIAIIIYKCATRSR